MYINVENQLETSQRLNRFDLPVLAAKWKKLRLPITLSILLSGMPLFRWPRQLLAQGDDGALYFLSPHNWLESTMQVLQLPHPLEMFTLPTRTFSVVITAVDAVLQNQLITQKLFFGASLCLGFWTVYLFLGRISQNCTEATMIRSSLSLLTCASPLLFQSYLGHLLISVFVMPVAVGLLVLFLRFIDTGIRSTLFWIAAVSNLGGFLYLATPWLLPLITIFPMLILSATSQDLKVLVKRTFLASVAAIFGNAWMVPVLVEQYAASRKLSAAFESGSLVTDFRAQVDYVRPDLLRISSHIPFNWNQVDNPWNDAVQAASLVFFGVVLLIFWYSIRNVKQFIQMKLKLAAVISSLVLVSLLIAPGWVPGTEEFVAQLIQIVPVLGILRNFQDKLVPAFLLAQVTTISLLLQTVPKRVIRPLSALLLLSSLGLSSFSLTGQTLMDRFQKDDVLLGIEEINRDYAELMLWINKQPIPRPVILQVPMSNGNWTAIQDETNQDLWFVGSSPLPFYSRGADFKAFGGTTEIESLAGQIETVISSPQSEVDDYLKLGSELGADYLLFLRGLPNTEFPFSTFLPKLDEVERLRRGFPSERVTDFGSRYSVVRITSDEALGRIKMVASNNLNSSGDLVNPIEVQFQPTFISEFHWRIQVDLQSRYLEVLVRQPFDTRFKLVTTTNQSFSPIESQQGWTKWVLDRADIHDNLLGKREFEIFFVPRVPLLKWTNSLYVVSWVVIVAGLLTTMYRGRSKNEARD